MDEKDPVTTPKYLDTTPKYLVRGHPSKTAVRKGGEVCANVYDLGRGGGQILPGRPQTTSTNVLDGWPIT